jgi:hypothetical protein
MKIRLLKLPKIQLFVILALYVGSSFATYSAQMSMFIYAVLLTFVCVSVHPYLFA